VSNVLHVNVIALASEPYGYILVKTMLKI